MPRNESMNLGDLISLIFEEFLATYGDEELASVATAATINDILSERARLLAKDMAA